MDREQIDGLRAFIATAEACWRQDEPSYSWHVLDWMSYKNRLKYLPIRKQDRIFSTATIC